ncbi:MAG: mannosyltransferase family protein [Leptolyngbya sp. BL-A-14]
MQKNQLRPVDANRPNVWLSLSPVAFALVMGLLSRLVILVSMMLIAPIASGTGSQKLAIGDWHVLVGWDSVHYLGIATKGYEYATDGVGHNVAFFPMLPLLIKAGMMLGLSPELAGALVNNAAFLGALMVLAGWVNDRYGQTVARWAVAALAWCPFSLFGTVVYTEGLFLLCSTAALRAFDRREHAWAAFWGCVASGTRLPGLTLAPAFLWVAWKERRSWSAYLAAIAAAGGALLFSLFCWVQFHDPLAFLKVQKAWHPLGLIYGEGWLKSFVQITLGPTTWNRGHIADPLYPIAFVALCGLGWLLWRFHQRLGKSVTYYGACAIVLLLWLLAGSPLINAVMFWGGVYLLWHTRRALPPVAVVYGFFSLVMILSSGRTISVERHAYGVVSLAIAMGLLLSRRPRWGYAVLGFFALLLVSLSLRFAQHLWAG